jgi:hypothetical protein
MAHVQLHRYQRQLRGGRGVAGVALVRDTKDRTGGHLAVPAEEWVSFLATLKHGDPIQ